MSNANDASQVVADDNAPLIDIEEEEKGAPT